MTSDIYWRCEHPDGDVKFAAKLDHKTKLEDDGYVCEVYIDKDFFPFEPQPIPPIAPAEPELVTALTVEDVGGTAGLMLDYSVNVPAGATDLTFTLTGGAGDIDLYVNFGAPATYADFDFGSFEEENEEQVIVPAPSEGVWWVMADVWLESSGATLTVTYML